MKFVRDTTHGFRERPHYEPYELDVECETIIMEFMRQKSGRLEFPIPTDALISLIERDADDLDLYADLTGEGENVQGLTCFYPGQKPKVSISKEISEDARHENRLRTTLTHEYCHVRFHDCLYQVQHPAPSLFDQPAEDPVVKCKRDDIIDSRRPDWMEWQAGYVCGALLMPNAPVKKLVAEFLKSENLSGPLE